MYRTRRRACPGCHSATQPLLTPVAGNPVEVDACEQCGGLFVEYFDGELTGLARSIRDHVKLPAAHPHDAHARVQCPDCDCEMERTLYLGTGPDLQRCGTCLAAFIERPQLWALARFEILSET